VINIGIIELTISIKDIKNSISSRKVIKYLDGLQSLYLNLAMNHYEEHHRKPETFGLNLYGLNFSDAKFRFKNHSVEQPLSGEDIFSQPLDDLETLIDYSKSEDVELIFKKIQELIPNTYLRRKTFEDLRKLAPTDKKDSINISYKSKHLHSPIIIKNISYTLHNPVKIWSQINKAKMIEKNNLFGILRGIITTTHKPYLLVETDTGAIVKCLYSEDSFKPDLSISDLRVTKDFLMLIGTYVLKKSSRAMDQLINIKEIYKIITDIDYESEEVKKDLYTYSGRELAKLYKGEPKNFKDGDIIREA